MVELLFILYGAHVARRRWWVLGLSGVLWFVMGLFFSVNAFMDEARIYPVYFVFPLAIDGILSIATAFGSSGTGRSLRYTKGVLFLVIALLVLAATGRSEMIIGLLVGAFLIVDAAQRAAKAYVVRFTAWRRAIALAMFEFLMGVWSFLPWPSGWKGEVGSDVGLLLMVSAFGILALAWRLARLQPGVPISRAVAQGLLQVGGGSSDAATVESAPAGATVSRITVTVHVWTPTGELASVDRAVSRYIAARDAQGVISTGHAALEASDIYISHYPAVEIDRSGNDFRQALRATSDNDVPGRFQPSYAEEAAGWCESTRKVIIPEVDATALGSFWRRYSADKTYNLTNRNCSSTVATALDAGIEGVLSPYAGSVTLLFRLLFSPELWVAAQMRRQAAGMAWTPGIVLDYARALSYVVALPYRPGRRAGRSGAVQLSPAPETEDGAPSRAAARRGS